MIEQFFHSVLKKHLPNTQLIKHQSVGGGCINNTSRLLTNSESLFIKWNSASTFSMFETEALGLSYLSKANTIPTPTILGDGIIEGHAYLLLEWIEKGHTSMPFWEEFGSGLAQLHKQTSEHFGFNHNNFIGRLHQSNSTHEDWSEFFILERIEPQLKLAFDKKLIDLKIKSSFQILLSNLHNLIPEESPSLLHGDLWSGNFLVNENSKPVLIDPAVYYGHRETELAFTHLFGGFDQQFYTAYQSNFPLESGFEERIDIHNLYPLLVHVNLFGSSYLTGIMQTLKRFT